MRLMGKRKSIINIDINQMHRETLGISFDRVLIESEFRNENKYIRVIGFELASALHLY